MRRTVFVTGATATGKSDWALRVAEKTKAVIFNCDSIQVYEGLCIGSSSPTADELARAPHYLYGVMAAPAEMNAGSYRELFFQKWSQLPEDAKVLVVGGTGFYFQAIERGMFAATEVPASIRIEIDLLFEQPDGAALAWSELQAGDPKEAQRIPPEDLYRLKRAIELLRSGAIPSELRSSFIPTPFPGPLLKTTLRWDRDTLSQRILLRAKRMVDQGLLDETKAFLDRGFAAWAPLGSVGYKQAVDVLQGRLARDQVVEEIHLRTRQLAKRQETWFKRDPDIRIFQGESERSSFVEACLRFFEDQTILSS